MIHKKRKINHHHGNNNNNRIIICHPFRSLFVKLIGYDLFRFIVHFLIPFTRWDEEEYNYHEYQDVFHLSQTCQLIYQDCKNILASIFGIVYPIEHALVRCIFVSCNLKRLILHLDPCIYKHENDEEYNFEKKETIENIVKPDLTEIGILSTTPKTVQVSGLCGLWNMHPYMIGNISKKS